ncbi:hypothetical protein F5Y04DRAFT_245560 [Hypomontagnella monticulosa]|nr:hypothetical protein F5Y04DRAFT_245560 [Hypomontagnella monticulosa]
MNDATSRLRRTFAYRTDDAPPSPTSSDDEPALDEQEQETLIASLAAQNDARNAQFRLLLLCLPAVSALPYLLALVSPNRGGGRLEALLSLTSLGATAWTLWALPPGVTGVKALDAWIAGSDGSKGEKDTKQRRGDANRDIRTAPFWAEEHLRSPLEKYLPYLNAGLCAVLVLAGFISKTAGSQEGRWDQRWGHVALSNLPAIVYGVVLAAKMVMGGVDPERELSALRYEYKGA